MGNSEVQNSPYAEFLETVVRGIFDTQPDKIAFVASLPNGETLTAYYKSDAQDKAVFAHHIYSDSVMDVVVANVGLLKEAMDAYEEEEE